MSLVGRAWPGQEKCKPQFAGGWAPSRSWAPLQTITADTMQCQRRACFLHLACSIRGSESTSALAQGTWGFWHCVRGSSSQRLMGIWSPLIHAPHVKLITVVYENISSISDQTFESELSSEHKSGVYLTYFCCFLLSNWNVKNVLRHYLIWEPPVLSDQDFLSRNQR